MSYVVSEQDYAVCMGCINPVVLQNCVVHKINNVTFVTVGDGRALSVFTFEAP
jgi:hypothetical protein